jgi:hypothetical protein
MTLVKHIGHKLLFFTHQFIQNFVNDILTFQLNLNNFFALSQTKRNHQSNSIFICTIYIFGIKLLFLVHNQRIMHIYILQKENNFLLKLVNPIKFLSIDKQ